MDYQFFSHDELKCSHTGNCSMDHIFMKNLVDLRKRYGKPIIITSGFRDISHPVEVAKGVGNAGHHTYGIAVDVAVRGRQAHEFLTHVFSMGCWTGVGIQQSGESRFIHIDIAERGDLRPWVWSY